MIMMIIIQNTMGTARIFPGGNQKIYLQTYV
jgi:hypothetical protein